MEGMVRKVFRGFSRFVISGIALLVILMQPTQKAKAGTIYDGDFDDFSYQYRYTLESIMSDYAQCEAIVAPFHYIAWSTAILVITLTYVAPCIAAATAAAIASGGAASPAIASCYLYYIYPSSWLYAAPYGLIAGGLFVVGAYLLASVVTDTIRMDASIYNTADSECTWKDCYDPGRDHTIDPEDSKIFNQIGLISDKYEQDKFIEPFDCEVVQFQSLDSLKVGYHVCAYEMGDEICSEIVFCSGIVQQLLREMQVFAAIFGLGSDAVNDAAKGLTFDKISGRAKNAYLTDAEARRDCGKDPWDGDSRDDANPNTENGNRCECTCCKNSGPEEGYEQCCEDNEIDTSSCVSRYNLVCDTYNERYHYHCVKRVFAEEELPPPVAMPSTMSSYCDPDNDMGYTPFSFAGRVMRCLEGTINNAFYGQMDDVVYDNQTGKPVRDPETGTYEFTKVCQDGTSIPANGYCESSFLTKINRYMGGFVQAVLSLYVSFIGITLLTGGTFQKKELFVAVMKVALIAYFIYDDAWKEGYYKALLTGSYEVSNEFFDAISDYEIDADQVFVESDTSQVVNSNMAGCVVEGGENYEDLLDELSTCDFFDGIQYSGVPYSSSEAYLAVWDSLDCRFSSFTGFQNNGFYPILISIAFAALFTSSTGIMFLIVVIVLFFSIFTIFARSLYIGVVAMLFVAILIFISPLTIVCFLFKGTKGIFDTWLKQLLGYSIQPAILFAFLAVTMKMLDLFFAKYMGDVINMQVTTTTQLGLVIPKIKSQVVTFSYFVGNLLRFTFLVLILQEIFGKLDSMLKQLTGVGGTSDGMPDVYGGMKTALGKGYSSAKNVALNAKRAAGQKREQIQESMSNKRQAMQKTKDGK